MELNVGYVRKSTVSLVAGFRRQFDGSELLMFNKRAEEVDSCYNN